MEQRTTDPRAAASRERLLSAAQDLVREAGPAAVSFATVAERAGVARATAYRHWPSVDAILDEALNEYTLPFFADPTPPLADWVAGELRRLVDELQTPAVARFTASLILHAAEDDSRDDLRRARLFGLLEDRLHQALGGDGEHATPLTRRAVGDALGPTVYRSLLQRQDIDDDEIAGLAARLVSSFTGESAVEPPPHD